MGRANFFDDYKPKILYTKTLLKTTTLLKTSLDDAWLKTYAPWLVYSKHLRGALCLYCVLFPPKIVSCVNLSLDLSVALKIYMNTAISIYHQYAVIDTNNFSEQTPVDVTMKTAHQEDIENIRKIMYSIISTIIYVVHMTCL